MKKILDILLTSVGLVTIAIIVYILLFGEITIKNENGKVYFTNVKEKPIKIEAINYDAEVLNVLEQIEENQRDIYSKMDTICDKLDNLK